MFDLSKKNIMTMTKELPDGSVLKHIITPESQAFYRIVGGRTEVLEKNEYTAYIAADPPKIDPLPF